jgi:hypothetical protein
MNTQRSNSSYRAPPRKSALAGLRQEESGLALYFVLGLLITIMVLIALVVEIPQQEVLQTQAKIASDSAALAAASHLDGTISGWEKAALTASHNLESNLFVNSSFQKQNTTYSIEFGFARMTSDPNGSANDNQFDSFVKVPLQTLPAGCDSALTCLNFDFLDSAHARYFGASQKSIANAVRINVTSQGAASVFGKIVGVMGYGQINKSAVSLVYDQQEYCVAPLAIPACALFLDTDPNHYGPPSIDKEYLLDDFDPILQSGRELIFTEASPWKPWTFHKRAFGLNRHLTYHRPPLINYTNIVGFPSDGPNECGIPASSDPNKKYPNCRADAIFGVLGAPGSSPGDTEAISPFDLEDYFTEFAKEWKNGPPSISTCSVKARFGAPFRPLENAVDNKFGLLSNETYADGDNPPTMDGDEPPKKIISRALKKLMPYMSTENFRNTFYDTDGQPKANIPLTRSTIEESIIRWPPYDKVSSSSIDEAVFTSDDTSTTTIDERTNTRILLKLQAPGQPNSHIKPLAHPKGYVTSEVEHGVKEVLAMVIGPAGQNPYCDYPAFLEQRQQWNTTPHSQSAPRIIGFVKVILVDYNFDQYTRMGDEQRSVFSSPDGDVLIDRNPIGIQIPSDASGTPKPEHQPYAAKDPAPWASQRAGEGEGDPGEYITEPTPTPDPNVTPEPTPTPVGTVGPEELWELNQVLEFPVGSGIKYHPKKYKTHPLPLRRLGCSDTEFTGRCHYLQDHPVQYGLGGITAALSIDLPMPLFGPRPVEGVTHPILIAVED